MMDKIEQALILLRQKKPLILNLTNFVTMDFVANCLLALGAAPIMGVCEEEIEELIKISSALYINIGTLDGAFTQLASSAIAFANRYQKPIVLDPVGAGATHLRTKVAKEMAPHATIIRGNSSEIIALGGQSHTTHGVESIHQTSDAKDVARLLAERYQATIAVSGAIDFITDGVRSVEVAHGSALMQRVTGMGCALTAVMAAFKGVLEDPLEAAEVSAAYFGLCGELTALHHKHPGSFKAHFIDELHAADFLKMRGINHEI